MAVKPVPDGYHTLTPYFIVSGADELLTFLKNAFGAEERVRMAAPDGSVGHAEVKIGGSVLMLADASGEWKPMPGMVHFYTEDTDAMYERALKAGAASLRAPRDEFYGDRSAGVQDPAGNMWWIATHVEDVPPEEIARRAAAQG